MYGEADEFISLKACFEACLGESILTFILELNCPYY